MKWVQSIIGLSCFLQPVLANTTEASRLLQDLEVDLMSAEAFMQIFLVCYLSEGPIFSFMAKSRFFC